MLRGVAAQFGVCARSRSCLGSAGFQPLPARWVQHLLYPFGMDVFRFARNCERTLAPEDAAR